MKKTNLLLILALVLLNVQYSNAQFCSAGPTSIFDSNVGNVSLSGDAGTSFDYTPPCLGITGVDDQTALSVTVTAGTMYTGSITWGTCGGDFDNSGTIWIDYNQNFVFESFEVIHTFTGLPTVTENFSFTLPVADAVNGTQRMRVMQRETSIAPPLDPCASYDWGSVIDLSIVITGATGTPAPTPICMAGPSSIFDSNMGQLTLAGDNGTSIDYTPPCNGITGLDDQTATSSADVTPGQTYSGSVTWGTCGGDFDGVGTIWVDFDNNNIFEASEVVHTWSGLPTVTENYSFTVPAGAVGGTTTMRVTQDEGGFLPIDPCANFTWGSVVDVAIEIASCDPATGVSIDAITDVAANVNFDANGEQVNVEITDAGAGQGTGTITSNVTSPFTFTSLTPSTGYDVYVQRDCGFGTSDWDGPFSFMTLAPCDEPTAISITNVTDTSADINWTTPNGEPANVEVTAAGAGQGNSVVLFMNGVTSPYAISGLADETDYDVYVQTDCGVLQSAFAGPTSFTTLVTPAISIVDSSGNGLPNIADPCDCADPENIVDPATNIVTYFHDFITIHSNPGETWELVSYTSGTLYDNALNPLPVGTQLTEVSPGFYRIDALHESLVGFEANFNRTTNPLATPLTASNNCDGVACSAAAVPTMGEWGMILFALIMLSFGVIFVMRQQVAVAGMGNVSASAFNETLPFNKTIFGRVLGYVMIGLAATFAVAIAAFGYEMTNADVPGSLLAGPALAYLIHLVILSVKK
ncbi:MAG: IPTL-CTERM sorting domain-containing protein [Bacteroidota bacterium]